MSEKQNVEASGLNRAKPYQLVLFPLNNGATNVYYVLVLSYIATFGSNVLALGLMFASIMVTAMRLCDAITDPIIGALIDRTNGKFGKFRPFMVIGNLIMAVSIILLYIVTPYIPADMMPLRYVVFVLLYFVWVIGYTFQTSCTRSGQTVLTNDPKQRPLFTIFNTVGSLVGMGVMQFVAPILRANVADYSSADFYRVLTPIGYLNRFDPACRDRYLGKGSAEVLWCRWRKTGKSQSFRVHRDHQEQQADAASDDRRSRMQTCAFYRDKYNGSVYALWLYDGQL